MKITTTLKSIIWLLSLCLSLPLVGMAQETMSEDDVIVLEEVEADNTVSIEESILPTTRPFVSLYGTEKSIVDTPRNVTIVSREQLDAIAIRDARDFSKLTSSAYTQSNFGAPSNPSVRGQSADVLVNNVRRGLTTNGNGFPVNFNSVESVNILKGPPSVVVGASQYVGGYVDLITKKPNFEKDSHELSLTVDSEGLQVAQLDSNYVLSDTMALRTSFTAEGTDNYFYDNQKRITQAAYGAVTWKPRDGFRLEVNGEYFNASYTENWGWNRVTQDLLDSGTYITGSTAAVNAGTSTQSSMLNDAVTYGVFGGGKIDPTGTTTLDRDTRLLGDTDDSGGEFVTTQAIATWTPDSDTTIKNNTLYQYRDRDTYSSYQYSEVMRDNFSFTNRTEYQKNIESNSFIHKLIAGLSIRYQDVEAANDFFHEPANAWDLSRPTSEIGVEDEFVFFDNPMTLFTGPSIPILGEKARGKLTLGRPASVGGDYIGFQSYEIDSTLLPAGVTPFVPFGASNPTVSFQDPDGEFSANNGDTNSSLVTQLGLFVNDDIQLSEKLSLILGGRVDYVNVEAEDPMYDDIIAFFSQYGAPGTLDAFVANNPEADSENHSEFLYNYNASLVYKPTDKTSFYVTGNYAESPPVGLGGGISVSQARDENAFVRESTLIEAGYKGSFLDDTLFANFTVYSQERSDPIQGGGSIDTEADGFEFELNYQPNNRFYATFGYSYTNAESANLVDSFIADGVPFDESSTVDTVVDFVDFVPATFHGPAFNNVFILEGSSQSPGVPEELFNFLVSYKFTDTTGVTASAVITSPMNLGYVGAVDTLSGQTSNSAEIGWQHTFDVGLFHDYNNWSFRFNILNVTDEENYGAVNAIYGNASVFIELPRRYELSASYKF
jgi:outer membrane receptor protein involved in Fe transport